MTGYLDWLLRNILFPLGAGFALVAVAVIAALIVTWVTDSAWIEFLGKRIPAIPKKLRSAVYWFTGILFLWFMGVLVLASCYGGN